MSGKWQLISYILKTKKIVFAAWINLSCVVVIINVYKKQGKNVTNQLINKKHPIIVIQIDNVKRGKELFGILT